MKKLEILEANALSAFNSADEKGKNLLSNLFGKEVFNQKITDRVKSFEDACYALGYNPDFPFPNGDFGMEEDNKAIIAFAKLSIIRKALNEGWTPDWSNSKETKYYPWMKYSVGWGFSFYDFGFAFTVTTVGSRLCFKSRELAEYAGEQFKDLYNDLFTL